MKKSKNIIHGTFLYSSVSVKRYDLVRIVDDASRSQPKDIRSELMKIAKTTNRVAFNTWGCFIPSKTIKGHNEECGCPMTKIGLVRLTEEADVEEMNVGNTVTKFTTDFDAEMRSITGVGNSPAVATITD